MALGIGDFILGLIFAGACLFFYKRGFNHGIRYGLDEIIEEMDS